MSSPAPESTIGNRQSAIPKARYLMLGGFLGAGKTTAADLFRREIGDDVIVVFVRIHVRLSEDVKAWHVVFDGEVGGPDRARGRAS